MDFIDYGHSFIQTSGPENAVRFLIESQMELVNLKTGQKKKFFQAASCRSENTFARENLFKKDNYNFLPVFLDSEKIIIFRSFEEPSLCMTKTGKILTVMRDGKSGFLWSNYSLDEGKTWSVPVKLDIWGCPANLLSLRDGRIVVTYGYRRPPYGVRACISEDDGKTWNIKDEIILYSDGLHGDIGYPSSIEIEDGYVMTAFYTHKGMPADNDNRDILPTFLEQGISFT